MERVELKLQPTKKDNPDWKRLWDLLLKPVPELKDYEPKNSVHDHNRKLRASQMPKEVSGK